MALGYFGNAAANYVDFRNLMQSCLFHSLWITLSLWTILFTTKLTFLYVLAPISLVFTLLIYQVYMDINNYIKNNLLEN